MHIVDAHLHYLKAGDYSDPEILIKSGVINKAWILSVNGYNAKHATDEEVIAYCRKYPDVLVPFGYLDFNREVDRIDWLKEQGCPGLKAVFPPAPYDSEQFFPYYKRAEELRMPIVFHIGGAYYGPVKERNPELPDALNFPVEQLYGRNMLPIHIDAIAKSFPDLTIIIAHLGGDVAYYEQTALICRGHNLNGRAGVYLDLSSDLCTMFPALVKFKQVMEDVGPDYILFGTDLSFYWAVKNAHFWEYFLKKSLRLKEEDVAKVMGLNAEKIIADCSV